MKIKISLDNLVTYHLLASHWRNKFTWPNPQAMIRWVPSNTMKLWHYLHLCFTWNCATETNNLSTNCTNRMVSVREALTESSRVNNMSFLLSSIIYPTGHIHKFYSLNLRVSSGSIRLSQIRKIYSLYLRRSRNSSTTQCYSCQTLEDDSSGGLGALNNWLCHYILPFSSCYSSPVFILQLPSYILLYV